MKNSCYRFLKKIYLIFLNILQLTEQEKEPCEEKALTFQTKKEQQEKRPKSLIIKNYRNNNNPGNWCEYPYVFEVLIDGVLFDLIPTMHCCLYAKERILEHDKPYFVSIDNVEDFIEPKEILDIYHGDVRCKPMEDPFIVFLRKYNKGPYLLVFTSQEISFSIGEHACFLKRYK